MSGPVSQPAAAKPICDLCGGRGWITIPDGGAGRAMSCPCRVPTIPDLIRRAGIPADYRSFTKEQYPGTWPGEQVGAWPHEKPLVFITGPVGAGKTHIGTALLIERIKGGQRCRWWDVGDLFETMKRMIGDPRGADDRLEQELLEIPFLLLDDLGVKHKTAWSDFKLAYVIRQRLSHERATILTSAVDLIGLDEIDPGLASRLARQIVINLEGEPDHRGRL